jgi:hypothetical protein
MVCGSDQRLETKTGDYVAGQEGIEPPTPGFGDRCSAN